MRWGGRCQPPGWLYAPSAFGDTQMWPCDQWWSSRLGVCHFKIVGGPNFRYARLFGCRLRCNATRVIATSDPMRSYVVLCHSKFRFHTWLFPFIHMYVYITQNEIQIGSKPMVRRHGDSKIQLRRRLEPCAIEDELDEEKPGAEQKTNFARGARSGVKYERRLA